MWAILEPKPDESLSYKAPYKSEQWGLEAASTGVFWLKQLRVGACLMDFQQKYLAPGLLARVAGAIRRFFYCDDDIFPVITWAYVDSAMTL